ncbi:MAG: peptidoglycan -binding protein [Natronohydrobacter sp.]|nr:peptidoglycan -binding protein [Natronohydrobacter sp.]
MALARKSGQRRDVSGAIWPGFVDAMTALLLVLMFVLSIFMIVQYVLRDTISAQDTQLEGLSAEVASLANALGLSRARVASLEGQVGALSEDLDQSRALAAAQLVQIAALDRDLAARGAELDAAQARITDFEAQVAALIASRDTAIAEGQALAADVAALEEAQARALSEQEALQLALASLRDELSLEAEAARLAAARADAVEAALAQAQAEALAQEATLAQLSAALAAVQEDAASREISLAQLAAALADSEAIRRDLSDADAALRADLDAAEAAALAEAAAAEALRARLADAQVQLSEEERLRLAEAAATEALRAQLADTEAQLSEEERRRLADAAAAEALRARLEGADAELTAMTLALEEQRRRAEETLTMLAAARAGQEELETALALEISERERLAALRAMAESALSERDAQSLEDQRRLEVLNQQVAALRGQVGGLQDLLGEARAREEAAQTQIESLGADLNLALAQLAAEERRRADLEAAERERLESFRSEFFGQLRQVLEGRQGVEIVGDRFVFSSEVLFELGSADLAPEGRAQIGDVVAILNDVADRIPPDIDWILQVEGHTDNLPIAPGGRFADNWALSQARALSVVRYLTEERGFPAFRLSAAGFGEYRPVDPRNTFEARSRNRRIELKLTER